MITNINEFKASRQEEELLIEAARSNQYDLVHKAISTTLNAVQNHIQNRDACTFNAIMSNITRHEYRNKEMLDNVMENNLKDVQENSHFSNAVVTNQIIRPLQPPREEPIEEGHDVVIQVETGNRQSV